MLPLALTAMAQMPASWSCSSVMADGEPDSQGALASARLHHSSSNQMSWELDCKEIYSSVIKDEKRESQGALASASLRGSHSIKVSWNQAEWSLIALSSGACKPMCTTTAQDRWRGFRIEELDKPGKERWQPSSVDRRMRG